MKIEDNNLAIPGAGTTVSWGDVVEAGRKAARSSENAASERVRLRVRGKLLPSAAFGGFLPRLSALRFAAVPAAAILVAMVMMKGNIAPGNPSIDSPAARATAAAAVTAPQSPIAAEASISPIENSPAPSSNRKSSDEVPGATSVALSRPSNPKSAPRTPVLLLSKVNGGVLVEVEGARVAGKLTVSRCYHEGALEACQDLPLRPGTDLLEFDSDAPARLSTYRIDDTPSTTHARSAS